MLITISVTLMMYTVHVTFMIYTVHVTFMMYSLCHIHDILFTSHSCHTVCQIHDVQFVMYSLALGNNVLIHQNPGHMISIPLSIYMQTKLSIFTYS